MQQYSHYYAPVREASGRAGGAGRGQGKHGPARGQPVEAPVEATLIEEAPVDAAMQVTSAPVEAPVGGPAQEAIRCHPMAKIFSLLQGDERVALKLSIRDHGLREAIKLLQGEILDGRNRYDICLELGIEPRFDHLPADTDPRAYVLDANYHRRHLTQSQRAMAAARLATLEDGQRADRVEGASIEAARLQFNVGRSSVERAKIVQRSGAEELGQAVDAGKVKVSAAVDIASELPIEEQREIVRRGTYREALKAIREEVDASKIAKAADIELPRGRRYEIILADAPLAFEAYSGGKSRTADAHYKVMSVEELCAMKVAEIAADDAALFFWVPPCQLLEGLKIMEIWDFRYVTHIVWQKDKIGLGSWVRNQHELLLIGKRGRFQPPTAQHRCSSVFMAARKGHSRKPDQAYALIEAMYPDAKLGRIELFARSKRDGWDVFGDEVESTAAPISSTAKSASVGPKSKARKAKSKARNPRKKSRRK